MAPASFSGDAELFSPPVFSALVPTLGLVLCFLWLLRRSSSRGAGLPPGSEGLPLIGETLRLVSAYKTDDPEPFIDERVRRHGRLFTTHVFGERTVFSADPEFNRVVLSSEGRGFESSYPSSISTLLGAHSLLLLHGSRHRRLHALTLSRFTSSAALRATLLPDIDRIVRLTLGSWSSGAVVRLLEQAKKVTFDLTLRQLMGCDPGDWTEGLRRHYLLLIDGFFSVPISLPGFLTSFTKYGRALQARKVVAAALKGVVRKRREEGDNSGGRKRDMLDDLLEADIGLSEEEVVDFMISLLVAGYETTSTIMTLAVKFLADCPGAFNLLKDEHEAIRSKKECDSEPLDWSDYKSMQFTQWVINETLRVANIISGVFRRTTSDINFKGFTIPKGCKVFASFRAVHLDPSHYADARTFNPWRWKQNDDILPQHRSSSASVFTPFGGGPRLCPGYELARVEICVFLHYLLTGFSWEVAEEDRMVYFPTTRTRKGYPIKVWRRGRKNMQ